MHRILLPPRCLFKARPKQYYSRFPLLRTVLFISLLACLQFVSVSFFTSNAMASTGPKPALQQATFTLDGVTVNVDTPFLPGPFTTAKPGAATQTAVATTPGINVHPFGAISITAVPYGTKPRTEGVPVAQAGGVQIYRASLHLYRVNEGDNPQPGPSIMIFGQHVAGEVSLMRGNVKVAYSSTVVVEWVVEAGKRIWIVRVTQEQPLGTVDLKAATSLLSSLNFLTFSSSTLTHLTTVNAALTKSAITNAVLSSYPFPDWWAGTCQDKPSSGTSPSGSYSMANWHGIDACGPVDTAQCSTFGGRISCSVLEWQCVELVQRYLVVAGYINVPYGANGNQIVSSYPNSKMNKISNGTPGAAPQPGDVLSYDGIPGDSFGHTSLVTGSNVNSSGNGTITVLEQNTANRNVTPVQPIPTETLNVNNWNVTVIGWTATVLGWLHDPNSNNGHIYALAPDKGQVAEYSGSGTTWNKIGDAAGTIFAGNYGVFATNPTSGDIYKYNGTPNSWTDIGQPAGLNQASEYAVTNNGVYASTPQGVFQYSGSGTTWTQVGAPASNIYGGGYGLFATDTSAGNIYKYNGTPNNWTQIGAPGTMFAVTNTGLYGLSSTGVYLYSGSGTNWTQIGVPSVAIYAAGNTIFATDTNTGAIYSYNGSGTNWTQIGNPAANIYGGSSSLLATDLSTGNVLEYMGTPMNWTLIGGPGSMFVSGA